MNIIVLKNKHAGAGKIFSSEPDLKELFSKYHMDSDIIEIHGSSMQKEISAAINKAPDVIAVSGGDGSISSAARFLTGGEIPLAVIPTGTLNHFAKDAGIPTDIDAAVRVIGEKQTKKIDVGEVNGVYFINNTSIGIYPKAVKHRDKNIHRFGRNKWVAMGQALLTIFRKLPMIDVKIKSDISRVYCTTPIIFIGNNEYKTDLFNAGVRQSLTGGKLSLFYPAWTGRFSLLKYALLALIDRLKGDKDFHTLSTEEVTIETSKKELEVAVDGEVIHLIPPLRYKIHPLALKIIVPAEIL